MRKLIELDKDMILNFIKNNFTITKIAQILKVSRATVYKNLQRWQLNHQEIKFNHNYFEKIDTEAKAYWLGFIMADGCVSITQHPKLEISIHQKDIDHLFKFKQDIKASNKIRKNFNGHSPICCITLYSKKICDDLTKLGCVPQKSLILKFPYNINKKFINHLVRGYFDGDGCFSWKNKQQAKWQPQITIVGTKDFLNGINKVANINYKICKSKSSNAYNIYISGTKVVQSFTNWLYKDATIFLERKRKI